jgi:hypothetical protein
VWLTDDLACSTTDRGAITIAAKDIHLGAVVIEARVEDVAVEDGDRQNMGS